MDAHILENWPLLCGRLVDVSMRTPEHELLSMVKSSLSSEEVLASVLPAHLATWMHERLAERREARKNANTLSSTLAALGELEHGRNIIATANQTEMFQNPSESESL